MTTARTTLTAGAAAAVASVALMGSVTVIVGAQLGFDLWPALGSPQALLLEVPAVSPTGPGTNPLLPAANPLSGAIGTLAGGIAAPAFTAAVGGALSTAIINPAGAVVGAVGKRLVIGGGRSAATGMRRVRKGDRAGSLGRRPTGRPTTSPGAVLGPATVPAVATPVPTTGVARPQPHAPSPSPSPAPSKPAPSTPVASPPASAPAKSTGGGSAEGSKGKVEKNGKGTAAGTTTTPAGHGTPDTTTTPSSPGKAGKTPDSGQNNGTTGSGQKAVAPEQSEPALAAPGEAKPATAKSATTSDKSDSAASPTPSLKDASGAPGKDKGH